MEAEIRFMSLQAKETLGLPEDRIGKEGSSLRGLGGA